MRQSLLAADDIVREHDGERPVVMETPVLGSGYCSIHVRCARVFSERRRDDFFSLFCLCIYGLFCHRQDDDDIMPRGRSQTTQIFDGPG